jgi:hypothetical protein
MRKLIALLVTTGSVAVAAQIPNPSIDYPTFHLSTYTSLRAYGYTKVFEHRPLLNVRSTAIPFEGSEVTSEKISGSLL